MVRFAKYWSVPGLALVRQYDVDESQGVVSHTSSPAFCQGRGSPRTNTAPLLAGIEYNTSRAEEGSPGQLT